MLFATVVGLSLFAGQPEYRAPLVGARCGAVVVIGNTDTWRGVILRAARCEEGKRITFSTLPTARKGLGCCPSLRRAEVELIPPKGQSEFWDIVITVQDRRGCWLAYDVLNLLFPPPHESLFLAPWETHTKIEAIITRVKREIALRR